MCFEGSLHRQDFSVATFKKKPNATQENEILLWSLRNNQESTDHSSNKFLISLNNSFFAFICINLIQLALEGESFFVAQLNANFLLEWQ